MATINYATQDDLHWLSEHDRHLAPEAIADKIDRRQILIARGASDRLGLLRFGLFWDLIPFMNLIHIIESHRGQGIGTALVEAWEREMASVGYTQVLTSSLANEQAQHFYRRLGYVDCGCLLLPSEACEIMFRKQLHQE